MRRWLLCATSRALTSLLLTPTPCLEAAPAASSSPRTLLLSRCLRPRYSPSPPVATARARQWRALTAPTLQRYLRHPLALCAFHLRVGGATSPSPRPPRRSLEMPSS